MFKKKLEINALSSPSKFLLYRSQKRPYRKFSFTKIGREQKKSLSIADMFLRNLITKISHAHKSTKKKKSQKIELIVIRQRGLI